MQETFTKVVEILYKAKLNDIEVILDGDRLQLKISEDKIIDQDIIDEIRENKQAILDFLTHENDSQINSNEQKITPFNRDFVTQIPLSFSQERLWFIDQLEGSLQYNLPAVLLLDGDLNIDALEMTFRTIVDRHEVLRTVIKENNGIGYQEVKPKGGWQLAKDPTKTYRKDSNSLNKDIIKLVEKPFVLSADHMLRVDVLAIDDGSNVLVIVMHHIASDAWSMPMLVKEISDLYLAYARGYTLVLPALPLQFADYAMWQRSNLRE